MTEAAANFIKQFLQGTWELFNIEYPGTILSIGTITIGFAAIGISIVAVRVLFGFGGSSSSNYKSNSTENPKISKERRKDEK